ncbi:MAG: hypothetical protein ACI95C_001759 [Pseudohongiellaceae bacterium]|jgi:hypothetical protein
MPTIFDHLVVTKPDLMLGQLKVSPQVYEQLETQFDGFNAHTAEIHEPTSMLFITPGEGTLDEAAPSD